MQQHQGVIMASGVCLCAGCSYDISTIASVIPAFASRQDLLVIDDGASYPIQQVWRTGAEHHCTVYVA